MEGLVATKAWMPINHGPTDKGYIAKMQEKLPSHPGLDPFYSLDSGDMLYKS